MDYTVKLDHINKKTNSSFLKKCTAALYEAFEFCAPAVIAMNSGYYIPDTDNRK